MALSTKLLVCVKAGTACVDGLAAPETSVVLNQIKSFNLSKATRALVFSYFHIKRSHFLNQSRDDDLLPAI